MKSKAIWSAIFICLLLGFSEAEVTELALFSKEEVKVGDVVEAVNYFKGLGEKDAVLRLIELGWAGWEEDSGQLERACWVASALYHPRDPHEVQNGYLGGLSLPDFPNRWRDWTAFPLVEAAGAYIVMDEGQSGTGGQVSIVGYLAWCMRWGKFREEMLQKPVLEAVRRELVNLFSSEEWASVPFETETHGRETEAYMLGQVAE